MKKITSYLSIVVLTFALAACSAIGGNTPEKVSEDFFKYLNDGNKGEAMKLVSSDASALSDTEVSLAIEGLKVVSKSLKVYLSLIHIFQFPIYKDRVAVSTGIVPLSNVGYSLVNDVTIAGRENANIIRQSFSGQGSLQSFYLGVGARVYRGLYAGANVKYHFGKLTHTVHLMPNAQVLSQDVYKRQE